jgi:predicted alpha-1,6-mannanase (GH76 family)
VPLEFLFSGTVFYGAPLQAARISWDSEAEYRLPVRVWKETMERHFRDTAWLRLRKERFDRLADYKSRRALATWEDVIDELLERA